MLGSQRGHADEWQICLAHLLRDTNYAIECGDTAFSTALKHLLLRAIAIGRRRDTLKDSTLAQYLADLNRRLDRIMVVAPIGQAGLKLRQRTGAARTPLRKGERLQDKIGAQLARIKNPPSLVRSFFRAPSVASITDW